MSQYIADSIRIKQYRDEDSATSNIGLSLYYQGIVDILIKYYTNMSILRYSCEPVVLECIVAKWNMFPVLIENIDKIFRKEGWSTRPPKSYKYKAVLEELKAYKLDSSKWGPQSNG